MRRAAGTIAVALLLAGCGKTDEPAMVNQTVLDNSVSNEMKAVDPTLPTRLTMSAQQFANAAAASDAFEIAEGKLAQQQASLPSTREFAAAMIAAHSRSGEALRQAATGANPPILPDPALSAARQAKVDALGKLSGNALDDQYLRDRIESCQATLGAFTDYAAHGENDAMRGFAQQQAPEVEAQLTMAKTLPR